jgi:hypothetical protein
MFQMPDEPVERQMFVFAAAAILLVTFLTLTLFC